MLQSNISKKIFQINKFVMKNISSKCEFLSNSIENLPKVLAA